MPPRTPTSRALRVGLALVTVLALSAIAAIAAVPGVSSAFARQVMPTRQFEGY